MDQTKVFDVLDRKIEKLLGRLGTLEQENERLKSEVTAARRAEKDAADSKGAVERLEKDHETVRERLEKLVATLEAAEAKKS
jgi:chaperonin cofactor prefoldin